ncbi:uncharacterized protein DUF993 [Kocuria rosea]|nr:uncharacterized protein DUF993 [Kocuria rosea]
MSAVLLPDGSGSRTEHVLSGPGSWTRPQAPLTARKAYAAAHVVPLVLADNTPGAPAQLDWDATLGFRHDIWSYGLGVADAMDTAQRGMGLDWPATQQLIRRSTAEASAALATGSPALAGRTVRDLIACGAGTDQLDPAGVTPGETGLRAVLEAYREQVEVVEGAGAKVILMASRALVRAARDADDYLRVYSQLLGEARHPVVLHWLGTMFDPALAGYWGSDAVDTATETFLELIRSHPGQVDGVKVSLLDAAHETRLRAARRRGSASTPATTSTTPSSSTATAPGTPTRCWGSSPASTRRRPPRCRPTTPGSPAGRGRSSTPRRSSGATSSAPRPSTTSAASRSCPGSTAASRGSRWSADCTRAAPCRTWSRCSGWPTGPGCCSTRSSPRGG